MKAKETPKRIARSQGRSSQKRGADNATRWRERLRALKKEHEALQSELGRVQAEHNNYRKAVIALMHEDIDFDKKELFGLRGQRPTIDELIAQLVKREIQ